MSGIQPQEPLDLGPEAAEVVEMIAEEYAWLRCHSEGIQGCNFKAWEENLPPEKRAIILHVDLQRFKHYRDLKARLLQPHGDH